MVIILLFVHACIQHTLLTTPDILGPELAAGRTVRPSSAQCACVVDSCYFLCTPIMGRGSVPFADSASSRVLVEVSSERQALRDVLWPHLLSWRSLTFPVPPLGLHRQDPLRTGTCLQVAAILHSPTLLASVVTQPFL